VDQEEGIMSKRGRGTAAALACAAVLTLAGARPAAALPGGGGYEDLWERAWGWWADLRAGLGGLANVWAEQGPGLDPNGAPKPVATPPDDGLANADRGPNGSPIQ
jgi:hypothetical protein